MKPAPAEKPDPKILVMQSFQDWKWTAASYLRIFRFLLNKTGLVPLNRSHQNRRSD
jgi:hypothetical protein